MAGAESNPYRGDVAWLDDGIAAGRIGERIPGNSAYDRQTPGSGTAWYHVATGGDGGEGTPGLGTDGTERPVAR